MTALKKMLRAVQRLFTLDKDKTGNEGVRRKIFVGTSALAPLVAFGSGIILGCAQKSLFLSAFFAMATLLFYLLPRLQPWIYKSLFFITLGIFRIQIPYYHQEQAQEKLNQPILCFSGTVVRRTGYLRGFHEGFIVKIKTPTQIAGWPILIYSPELLVPGDVIQSPLLKVKTINQNKAPGYCMFLLKEGAYAVGTLPEKAWINKENRSPLQAFLYASYDRLISKSKTLLGGYVGSLVNTLFLGARDANPNFELRESFNRWGIAHYLARSGLHIVILMYAWLTLFSYLPIHLFVRRLLALLLALFYYVLTIPSISFTRAIVLFLFINSALLFKRKAHGLHILTVICFLTLLANPFHLFFLDFQLTFALTYSLIGSRYL